MYTRSAEFYDAIHKSTYDIASASDKLLNYIKGHLSAQSISLLDVACGTGAYLVNLNDLVQPEGLDLSSEMLAIAHASLPDVPFHQGDMTDFDLGREFDVVICLGSSIGYAVTTTRLNRTMKNLARHVRLGGLVVVEPWIAPDVWEPGRIGMRCSDQPELMIAQITVSGQREGISTLDIHYLVGSTSGVEHFDEHHDLGLFTHDDHLNAFHEAGLEVSYDPVGLLGRGLYVGVRSL